MTKPQNRLLVTPSLLNSWLYIDQVKTVYKDNYHLINDDIEKCYGYGVSYLDLSEEDQEFYARQLAFQDFVNTLKRVPFEGNRFTEEGIKFEAECIEVARLFENRAYYDEGAFSKGALEFGAIISNGSFQAVGTKEVTIDGFDFLMYGRLDVLKAGVIYDIKRIWKYERPKYKWSSQHGFYMDLFPNVKMFEYLIYDGNKVHIERYMRGDYKKTEQVISEFINFLKNNTTDDGVLLWDIYCEKWVSLDKTK